MTFGFSEGICLSGCDCGEDAPRYSHMLSSGRPAATLRPERVIVTHSPVDPVNFSLEPMIGEQHYRGTLMDFLRVSHTPYLSRSMLELFDAI